MAGKHQLKNRQVQHATPRSALEVVDARTLTAYVLTTDALNGGRLASGRYIALCGQDVLPACLSEPGKIIKPEPGVRGPAWAAREALVQAGLAEQADIQRWSSAFERADGQQDRPTMFAPLFVGIGRAPRLEIIAGRIE